MALNKQDLINGFCKAGINKGDEIEVHSSLSSFGFVDGGAETVISALKETVGDNGSIFMPALRLSPELPLTEEDKKAGEPPVKPWYAIQAQAYEKGLIREGYIGSCKYMCFGIWDVAGLYRQALETDPLGLYGLR